MAEESSEVLKKLTTKQRLFVKYLPECKFNATEAAKRAGYSQRTAHKIATENLQKPAIQSAIDEELRSLEIKAELKVVFLCTGWPRM